MTTIPLQSGASEISVLAVLFASELVTVILGLTIAYIAYRGYRRNDSRPMLFIAIGFLLVTGLPALAATAFFSLAQVDEVTAGVLSQAAEITGMLCILYALLMRT